MKSLKVLHNENSKKLSDKWELYLTEYDRLLHHYREEKIRLLEIGVQNGGSLDVWAKYFPKAELIVGCDIDPSCARLKYEDTRINLVIGDASSEVTKENVLDLSSTFDIIIDDGSHTSRDIIITFIKYFEHLEEGGIYIVEDLHCSYWLNYEGGIYHPFSALNFFKTLTDFINHEHWGLSIETVRLFQEFSEHYDIEVNEESFEKIVSIEFINSVCLIRKGQVNGARLGSRNITRGDILVFDKVANLGGTFCIAPNQNQNPYSNFNPTGAKFQQAFSDLSIQKETLESKAKEHRLLVSHLIKGFEYQIASQNLELSKKNHEIHYLESRNRQLIGSISWKITAPLRFVRRIPTIFLGAVKTFLSGNTAITFNKSISGPYTKSLMSNPKVSILAICYNSAKDLDNFISSIFRQNYPNFELIVLDNASTDSSVTIVKNFQKLYGNIRLVESAENLGFAEGNNLAREHAVGELFALINVDTVVDENWLTKLVSTAEGSESIGAVTSKVLFFEKFQDIKIQSSVPIRLSVDILVESLAYKKYFIRAGKQCNGYIESDDLYEIILSIPEQSELIYFSISAFNSQYEVVDVVVHASNISSATYQLIVEQGLICNVLLDGVNSYGKNIINNAGSLLSHGMPQDRGMGEYDRGQYDQSQAIDVFCGCSVLIKRSAVINRPLFIPEFFAYYEDSELSQWLVNNGLEIIYQPESIVFHRHSATTSEGSLTWQCLVRRSNAIYRHLKGDNGLLGELANIQEEFYQHIPSLLAQRLLRYDGSIKKKVDSGQEILQKRRAVGIYDGHWNTKGGGESHALSIASELSKIYPVDLISENEFDIDSMAAYFGLDLSRCAKVIRQKDIESLTGAYEIFINATYGSNLVSSAKNSYYVLHFPQEYVPREFLKCYTFLYDSPYVERWAKKYWGDDIGGEILYPVRTIKIPENLLIMEDKKVKKSIISVGRFFPNGHSKNQKEIIEAFRKFVESSQEAKSWTLILAGSLDMNNLECLKYFTELVALSEGLPVRILPNASRETLTQAYYNSCIYIHASGLGQDPLSNPQNFEHFGITPLEAMVHGVIPIVYEIGGPADLIEHLGIGKSFSSVEHLADLLHETCSLNPQEILAQCNQVRQAATSFINAENSKKLNVFEHDENI